MIIHESLREALEAAGLVIVPIKPTGTMMLAGEQAGIAYLAECRDDMTLREARPSVCVAIYAAMIAVGQSVDGEVT